MPRKARIDVGGVCYHVLNRGNERQTVFHNENEYASFGQLLEQARQRQQMRILGFCLMPNHFHLCLWPVVDGDLGKFMQWLMTAHVAQHRKSRHTTGHVWQGRFKAFATQDDSHLLSVLRYIERNPVRAGLASSAPDRPWSSAGFSSAYAGQQRTVLLHQWPIPRPADWSESLRLPENEHDLTQIRLSVNRESPFGEATWAAKLTQG